MCLFRGPDAGQVSILVGLCGSFGSKTPLLFLPCWDLHPGVFLAVKRIPPSPFPRLLSLISSLLLPSFLLTPKLTFSVSSFA